VYITLNSLYYIEYSDNLEHRDLYYVYYVYIQRLQLKLKIYKHIHIIHKYIQYKCLK